jgi:hypothetical protein
MPAVTASEQGLDSQVYHWVRGQFIRLGFNRRQAAQLALVHASWHEAEVLLAAGCPVDTVFDLLS